MGSSAHPDTIKAKEAKDQEMDQVRKERELEKLQRRSEKLAPELAGLTPEEIEKIKKDPKFAAFLNVMKPRKKTKFWEDDDMRPALTEEAASQFNPESTAKPGSTAKSGSKAKPENSDESSEEDDETFANPSIDEVKAPAAPAAKPEEKMSDLQYLKSKQASNFDDDSDVEEGEEGDEGDEGEEEEEEAKEKAAPPQNQPAKQEAAAKTEKPAHPSQLASASAVSVRDEADAIAETGRLFLRNLAYTTTVNDITALFSPYGTLSEVTLPLDSTKRPKVNLSLIYETSHGFVFVECQTVFSFAFCPQGIGYVAFTSPGCAVKAFQELDKSSFLVLSQTRRLF